MGNRETQTYDDGGTPVITTYTYNDLDQLTSDGTNTYTYDDRGNLIQITDGVDTTMYAWDAQDRMAGVLLPDTTVIAYTYDADGRRVQQDVDGTITNYLWDEVSIYGDVVMEYDDLGDPLVDYTLADGQLLSQTRSATTNYYLPDAQGSVRALANGSGSITDTYDYLAFGDLFASSGSTVNSYLYTGQQFDDLTGLYSLRARYYGPTIGRFLSRDTFPVNFQNPIELNRYGYAANNPVNNFDPSGLLLVETGQQNFESGIRSNKPLKSYAVGAASLYCYVLWAIGTYAGEANVCGFQASVTNNGISVHPFFAPDIKTPAIGVEVPVTFSPEIDFDPFGGEGGDPSSGGGGGESLISKAVNTGFTIATLIDQLVDIAIVPETEPEEEPLPDPPDEDECIQEDTPGATLLSSGECDDDGQVTTHLVLGFAPYYLDAFVNFSTKYPPPKHKVETIAVMTVGEAAIAQMLRVDYIHFTTEQISSWNTNYVEFANEHGNNGVWPSGEVRRSGLPNGKEFLFTAWELWHVRNGHCNTTLFYTDAGSFTSSLTPSIEEGKKVCGPSYTIPQIN